MGFRTTPYLQKLLYLIDFHFHCPISLSSEEVSHSLMNKKWVVATICG